MTRNEQREPTEGATAPAAPANALTVGTLEMMENDLYTEYGVDSKPAGLLWVSMALDLAKRITEAPGLLDAITPADLDRLTEDNFHTARHAAEVAQHLRQYTV